GGSRDTRASSSRVTPPSGRSMSTRRISLPPSGRYWTSMSSRPAAEATGSDSSQTRRVTVARSIELISLQNEKVGQSPLQVGQVQPGNQRHITWGSQTRNAALRSRRLGPADPLAPSQWTGYDAAGCLLAAGEKRRVRAPTRSHPQTLGDHRPRTDWRPVPAPRRPACGGARALPVLPRQRAPQSG